MVNVSWNDVGVLALDEVVHVWLDNCRRVSPQREYRPCVNLHQRNISASVEMCETEVCFLHIRTVGTKV